jgi:hypothetical protein
LPTLEGAILLPRTLAGIIAPRSDTFGAGLAQAPPARPPRS